MIKRALLLCLCCFAFQALNAKTVSLYTGHWIPDRYRNVEVDVFDYHYQINNIDHNSGMIELTDGSEWHVEPMKNETSSFYGQQFPFDPNTSIQSIFSSWYPGDIIIFHKVVDRDTLLAYNLTRDHLLDVLPMSAPKMASLQIANISNTNEISYSYHYNDKTDSYEQHQSNKWRTVIVLTDGSVWECEPNRALVSWIVGDPVHVSKDNPWWSSNTHILMNFRAKKSSTYATPEYKRIGVWNVG